jgi:uncharacterized protein (DUF849 family)
VLVKACLNGGTPRAEHPAVAAVRAAAWSVLRAAIRLGRDIRVGLEDTTVLPGGRLASGNAELIETAVRLVAELGRWS